MTTIELLPATTHQALKVACHQCQTRYRVRHSNRLTSSASRTCRLVGPVRGGDTSDSAPSRDESFAEVDPSSDHRHHIHRHCHRSCPEEHCSFHGTGGTLLGMQIVNICLSIATVATIFGARLRSVVTGSVKPHSPVTDLPITGPAKSSIKDFSKRCWFLASHIFRWSPPIRFWHFPDGSTCCCKPWLAWCCSSTFRLPS